MLFIHIVEDIMVGISSFLINQEGIILVRTVVVRTAVAWQFVVAVVVQAIFYVFIKGEVG